VFLHDGRASGSKLGKIRACANVYGHRHPNMTEESYRGAGRRIPPLARRGAPEQQIAAAAGGGNPRSVKFHCARIPRRGAVLSTADSVVG
jgi:hypothetical protein